MDIQRHIQSAIRTFSGEILIYLVAGIIVSFLSGVTLGLLAGPLMGGFVRMALLHIRTGKSPQLGDLAYGFQEFGNLFFFFVILILVLLGFFLFIVPGVIFSTWWMYALILMVDRKTGYREAMEASKARVTQAGGFFPHLGFLVVVFFLPPLIVHALAAVFAPFGLLHFVIFPLQALAVVHAYQAEFETPEEVLRVD
ncbi:MAG: hypothetical protein AB1640_21995 [bacterium]